MRLMHQFINQLVACFAPVLLRIEKEELTIAVDVNSGQYGYFPSKVWSRWTLDQLAQMVCFILSINNVPNPLYFLVPEPREWRP